MLLLENSNSFKNSFSSDKQYESKDLEHRAMHQTVNEGIKTNDENTSINKFGKLLDEA